MLFLVDICSHDTDEVTESLAVQSEIIDSSPLGDIITIVEESVNSAFYDRVKLHLNKYSLCVRDNTRSSVDRYEDNLS